VGNRRSSDAADGTGTIMGAAGGRLVISFDFELFWGVRDSTTLARYGPNILGVREAIPRLLETFEKHGIRATWGTVGFLFFDDKDELLAHLPGVRPDYADRRLSPYEALSDIGPDEKRDPYHFGLSLIRQILACPGQEIGTHTFAHYYCLEPGQTAAQLREDLAAAQRLARTKFGRTLESLVFPRNPPGRAAIELLKEVGILCYRGNERAWCYRARNRESESRLRRLVRLLDTYFDVSGANTYPLAGPAERPVDLPSSRFLRPYSPRLRALDGLRLRRIRSAMATAARRGEVFHLWWHPENFGTRTSENLAFLERVLAAFDRLRARHGMRSLTMAEAARERLGLVAGGGRASA
jgi:peptidoglycan/xylan/chitin deacetylase (PgdA/CDA1 family)